jgi:adenylate kinase family enzyme
MKQTLYVNLYGAPGSGKSTGAAFVFSKLKLNDIDCEYVQEYAKDKVWEENTGMFNDPLNQIYIGAKQFYRLNRLNGKVDVVITDSPLLLSTMYIYKEYEKEYTSLFKKLNANFNTCNVFINRVKPYNSNGRNQTENEANTISDLIKDKLTHLKVPFTEVNGNEFGYLKIVNLVEEHLKSVGEKENINYV